jgi:cell division protein FtsQ
VIAIQEDSAFSLWVIRNLTRLFGLLVILLGGIVAFQGANRPIVAVHVDGAFERVAAGELELIVRSELKGGMLTANLREVSGSLQKVAWVDSVVISRQWPNALRVSVEEQVPVAQWGQQGLINVRGEVFEVKGSALPEGLPKLEGPDPLHAEVAVRYLAFRDRLSSVGLSIAGLKLDSRGAWELELTDGTRLKLGRRQVTDRIDRFVDTVAPLMVPLKGRIEYVDLRYSNGFSIGWKKGLVPNQQVPEKVTDNG